MAAPPGSQGNLDLPGLVRNYVHYDNLTNTYSKQASGARKLRDDFESKIIHTLRSQNMENAIIQVQGAKLQVGSTKSVPSLSMPRLKTYLEAYYRQKGNAMDESVSILRFINLQKQADTQEVACLKKTSAAPAIPPPPGSASQSYLA
jgi:hypothetical protein